MATFVMTNLEPRAMGAFTLGFVGTGGSVSGNSEKRAADFNLKASASNSLYRGSTLQTDALRLLAIVKY